MVGAALCTLMLTLAAGEIDPYDQSRVPIEVDTHDPKLVKIVLVAGTPSHPAGTHEYLATQAVLMSLLVQTPRVFVVVARDSWPKNPAIFDGARTIVWYTDGANRHPLLQPERAAVIGKHIDGGGGFVALHYPLVVPKAMSERALGWLGGHFDAEISAGSGAVKWTPVFAPLPRHPITRGVKPFALNDEWYFNLRFVPGGKGITPILKAVPPEELRAKSADAKQYPGRAETLAWAYERPGGGRSFAITTPHTHEDWANEDLRRLVVNAILWTAKVEVPKAGAKVALDPADLKKNLDDKRPKNLPPVARPAQPSRD